MHFGENQLSRSLIGLSPLTTDHPPTFQRWWVRPSTRSYPRFSLPMARSLRFGSRTRDYTALFGLAFATAPPPGLTSPRTTNSQAHSSKGTPSPATSTPQGCTGRPALTGCRHTVSGTLSLPSRGTFHLSLTVLVRYRSPGSIQGLPGGPGRFTADYRSPPLLGNAHQTDQRLSPTGLSPSTVPLPNDFG